MPRTRHLVPLALVPIAIAAAPAAAPAATFTVTTTADRAGATCGATCSLRQAIRAANATPGPHVITLPAGTLRLTRTGADGSATAGDLDVRQDTQIVGQGVARTTVDARRVQRAFDLRAGSLRIAGVRVRGGNAGPGGGGAVRAAQGGTFAAQDVVLADGRGALGGLLRVDRGTATVTRAALLRGTASTAGGAAVVRAGGTLVVENATLSGNRAPRGAGLQATGAGTALQLFGSTLVGNVAGTAGDSIDRGTGASAVVRGTILGEDRGAGSNPNDACAFPAGELALTELARSIDPGTSCGTGADVKQATDPQVVALRTDGGNAMPVAPLLASSPALDAVSQGPALDARGLQRPAGGAFDIGAYEAGATLDLVAPRATVGGAREARRSTILDRGLTFTVRCDEPCSSVVRLTRSGRTVAKSTTATRPRSERKVAGVRPKSTTNRSSVRRATELTLRVEVADARGNRTEAKRTIRVR